MNRKYYLYAIDQGNGAEYLRAADADRFSDLPWTKADDGSDLETRAGMTDYGRACVLRRQPFRPEFSGTPWGDPQTVEALADNRGEILRVTTATHGGIWLCDRLNRQFSARFPDWEGFTESTRWFEEDLDACVVYLAFARRFRPREIAWALRTARLQLQRPVDSYRRQWDHVIGRLATEQCGDLWAHIRTMERGAFSYAWDNGGHLVPCSAEEAEAYRVPRRPWEGTEYSHSLTAGKPYLEEHTRAVVAGESVPLIRRLK